jgi:hypothetical protein
MSEKMIAYCGLNCVKCPIYLATRETNAEKQKQKREEIARQIEEKYGMQCRVEDVTDCDGCPAQGGRLFSGCQKCRIRKCAREKGIENCAHCSEYACEKLEAFFNFGGKLVEGDAKKRLDGIRKSL